FYGLYTNLNSKYWDWVLEAYMGELEQETTVTKMGTGHSDLSYIWSKTFSVHLRYDYFDPNLKKDGDAETQISLAFMLSNPSHSSNFILVGTKDIQQGPAIHDDQVRL